MSSRNSVGCWTLPGGGVEPNESDATAALREAKEEVSECPLPFGLPLPFPYPLIPFDTLCFSYRPELLALSTSA